jgi:hypothetical protein
MRANAECKARIPEITPNHPLLLPEFFQLIRYIRNIEKGGRHIIFTHFPVCEHGTEAVIETAGPDPSLHGAWLG